jgi:hypothetical protein
MPIRSHPASGPYLGRNAALAGLSSLLVALLSACAAAGPAAAPATSGATTPGTGDGASRPAASSSPAGTQAPVPAESNPPGDIPDTTVYVAYRSQKGHVQLKVPEGWSRQDATASSTFSSNLNSITIAWTPKAAAPSAASARATVIPALQRGTLAFRLMSVRTVRLNAGPAIEITYQVNSPPNQVTGRQYRLVIERFELTTGGRGVVLSLSSAVGSDNVDPWRIVSQSLRWI